MDVLLLDACGTCGGPLYPLQHIAWPFEARISMCIFCGSPTGEGPDDLEEIREPFAVFLCLTMYGKMTNLS